MTIHPRHECHACCPLRAEKPGIQRVVGNTHATHVGQVVSSFQKILRGSQLGTASDVCCFRGNPFFFSSTQFNSNKTYVNLVFER